MALQSGGGSSAGDPGVEYLSAVGIGDRVTPLRCLLFGGDLSGDVSYYRSVSGDLCWFLVKIGKGGQVDANINYPPIRPSRMVVVEVGGPVGGRFDKNPTFRQSVVQL
ncbi:MAG: hypothetical protein V3S32_08140 [Acidimicrobiia bacterium]